MRVWMTKDGETGRISILLWEPSEHNYPRDSRAELWETRVGDIDEEQFNLVLQGKMKGADVTAFHKEAWERGEEI